MSLMKRSGWTSVSTMAPCETVWPVSLYEVSQKLKWRWVLLREVQLLSLPGASVSRLGCRDPTFVMTSLRPNPPTSGGSTSMYNLGDGNSVDSNTPLSMFCGASSSQTVLSQQFDAPEPSQPSQSQAMPRRGSLARRAPDITTLGIDALKPRRKQGAVKKRKQ